MTQATTAQSPKNTDLFEQNFSNLIAPLPATLSMTLPPAKISGLLDQALSAIPKTDRAPILCVTSAHTDEGAGVLSANLACVAATRHHATRVLLIDTGTPTQGKSDLPRFDLPTTINAFLSTSKKTERPIACLDKTNVHVAILDSENAFGAFENNTGLEQFIADCSAYFDVIIIHINNAIPSPHTLRLVRFCDGILISVRAEKSRLPVLSHLKLVLERTQTPIIGVVLYARRRYIPAFLYRLIFRG